MLSFSILSFILLVTVSAQRREPDTLSAGERFPLTGGKRIDDSRTSSGSAGSSGSFGFDNDVPSAVNADRRPPTNSDSRDRFTITGTDSRNTGSSSNNNFDTGFNRLTTERPSDRFGDRDSSRTGNRDTSDQFGGSDRDSSRGTGNRDDSQFGRRTTSESFGGRVTTDRSDFGGERFDNRRTTDRFDRFDSRRTTDSGRFVGSGSMSRNTFPQNYRIETEIQRVENKGGQLADGKSCDFLSGCDTKLYALIDTDSSQANWPGSTPVTKWPVIVSLTNEDSPTVNKAVTRDVCGTSVTEAALRVLAVDTDSVSAEDEINRFKCNYPLAPRDVASDPAAAQWGESRECEGTSKLGKSKLFARQRVYEISSSSCNSQRFS